MKVTTREELINRTKEMYNEEYDDHITKETVKKVVRMLVKVIIQEIREGSAIDFRGLCKIRSTRVNAARREDGNKLLHDGEINYRDYSRVFFKAYRPLKDAANEAYEKNNE